MKIDVTFREVDENFLVKYGEYQNGFDKGFEAGLAVGFQNTVDQILSSAATLQNIESNIVNVGDSVLRGFVWLQSLSLPNAEVIGGMSFRDCESLRSVYIPRVKVIERYAFAGTSLTSIVLPSTVESMKTTVFSNCTNLTDIYVAWEEGKISGAPWGAPNATVHYNWTGESEE